MDDLSTVLFDRLVEKTFESMEQEERLVFVERLFRDLPTDAQRDFLLKLALQTAGVETMFSGRLSQKGGSRVAVKMIKMGPESFGPWQMCCLAMNDFVKVSEPEHVKTADIARMFTGLADETRLRIVKLLSEREHAVDDLVQALGVAQSTTSHHLRVLKDAGLIRGEKRGRSIYYSLVHPLEENVPTKT